VWRALDEGRTLPEIVALASTTHPGAPPAASAEIEAFVLDVEARGLVRPLDPGVRPPLRANAEPAPPAAPGVAATPWTTPVLESHHDLEDLLLLDPVHDVTSAGWPHAAPPAS
jgi:hypothetical protein